MDNKLQSEADNEITLRDILLKIQEWSQYLFTRWAIIASFIIVGGLIGFIYAYFKKPIYTASTTFVLEEDKAAGGGLGSLAGLASMAGLDLGSGGGGIFQGDNILELYRSRTMIEKTLLTPIEKGSGPLLIDRYVMFNRLSEKWADKPTLLRLRYTANNMDIKEARLRDSVLGETVDDIRKNYLSISRPDKKLSIIKVDVRAVDELFAKVFNNALVKNVNAFYVETKTKKSLHNAHILQQKTDSVRAVMQGAVYAAVRVADSTPNINPTRQVQRIAPAQNAQFSAEVNKAILGELLKNLELTKMNLLKETPLIQSVDDPVFPLKKEKLSEIKGSVLGGIVAGLIGVLLLIVIRIYKAS